MHLVQCAQGGVAQQRASVRARPDIKRNAMTQGVQVEAKYQSVIQRVMGDDVRAGEETNLARFRV